MLVLTFLRIFPRMNSSLLLQTVQTDIHPHVYKLLEFPIDHFAFLKQENLKKRLKKCLDMLLPLRLYAKHVPQPQTLEYNSDICSQTLPPSSYVSVYLI